MCNIMAETITTNRNGQVRIRQLTNMKLKWMVLIYPAEFLAILYLLNFIGLLDTKKVVNGVVIGLIVGIVVGFASAFMSQWIIRFFDKKDITRKILSEINTNQNLLQPFSDGFVKLSDSNIEISEEDKFPNILTLNTEIYYVSLGKLGLLEDSIITKLVQYYSELKRIEEEYKELDSIHEISLSSLKYYYFTSEDFQKKLGTFNYNDKSIPKDRIMGFFQRAKKAYDLGEELVIGV